MTGSVVRQTSNSGKPYSDNHEKELAAFIKAAMSKKELKPELLTVGVIH